MSKPDILSALRILRDAPGGILRTHRDLTLQICEHVKSILSSTDNESTRGTAESCSQIEERDRCRGGFSLRHAASIPTLTCLDGSVAESRPTDPPCEETANNQSGPSNSSKALSSSSSTNAASTRDSASKSKQTAAERSQPVKLLKAVRQHLPKLEEFSQTIPSLKDLLEQESKALDLRLNYIKRVDGNKTPSDQERLLKGLSQISLAKQFISWERCRGWESKVVSCANRSMPMLETLRAGNTGNEMAEFPNISGARAIYLLTAT
ncbi:hypothetical protein N7540_010962 [Penicillium herquei]|nr:hypothetical protein N7540_010962 [Penicillium herquei]